MSTKVKLGLNCLLVTGLTLAGIFAFVNLPRFTLEPLQWAAQHTEEPLSTAIWFVYSVLLWAVLATVVAWCMLILKPRYVVLYGLVSAATFVVAGQSWDLVLHGNPIGYLRELLLVLTVPLIYWALVQRLRETHGEPSHPDAGAL